MGAAAGGGMVMPRPARGDVNLESDLAAKALASGGSSGLRDLLGNIEYTMRDADSSVWLAVLFGMVVLWFVFLRK